MLSRAQRSRIALVIGAIVVAVVAVVAAVALAPPRPPDVAIERVEEAVALGILDQAVVDTIRADGSAEAIVHLDTRPIIAAVERAVGPDRVAELMEQLRQALEENKGAILEALGARVEVVRDFDRLGAFVLTFRSEEALLAALRLDVVEAIVSDTPVSVPEPVDEAVGEAPAPASESGGAGVAIGVLDTGLDMARDPAYFPAGRVAATFEAAPDDFVDDDANGHGTHVASTVLLVAPQATLYVADVFSLTTVADDRREIRATHVLEGLRWMLDQKAAGANLRAVNLSIGGGHYPPKLCTDWYRLADVHAQGLIPVVAAGNWAFHDDDYVPTTAYQSGLASPACVPEALSVGAVTNGSCGPGDTFDQVTDFSQSSTQLQMLAPGECIRAAGGVKSGTSMAAPHVAGAVAVLAAAKPDATASEIWNALVQSGPPVTDPNSGITVNRLDVQAALQRLTTGTSPVATPRTGPEIRVTMGPGPVRPLEVVSPGGSYALSRFGVRNVSPGAATYRLVVTGPDVVLARPAPASWFALSPPSVLLPAGAYQFVAPTLLLPADAPPGDYAALIVAEDILTGELAGEDPELSAVRVQFTVGEGAASGPLGDLLEALLSPLGLAVLVTAAVVVLWLGRRRAAA